MGVFNLIYDLRTNKHFTLKTNPLKCEDLDEFVQCYNPENRYQRTPTWSEKNPDGRWRAYDYEELINRGKPAWTSSGVRDESLEELTTATKLASISFGSAMKASKNPTTSPIQMFSPKKSSKTWKPPWNNSAKSPRIWAEKQRKRQHRRNGTK